MRIRKLVGTKCYLSPMDAGDAERYAMWLNDLDVTIYTQLGHHSLTVDREKEILASISKAHNYGIVDTATDSLVGSCGLMDIDHVNRTAEIGIVIGDKAFWGRGYGAEAMGLLLDYGFRYLDLYNVMLRVYSFNERGLACYRKVGFRTIGSRRGAIRRNLEAHDIVFMDVTADDYYAGTRGGAS